MKNSNKIGKNFIQSISEKITNIATTYDIDNNTETEPIFLNNKISPKFDLETPEEININNILRESQISPRETTPPQSHDLSPINSVNCKLHQKSFLKIEQNTFEVICEKCIEEGNKSQLEINPETNNLLQNNKNIIKEDEFNCYKHEDKKGSFYCDECKEFICKFCFADEHRKHKCHLPEMIKKELIENIQESINFSSELTPIFNESVIDIKKIHDNLKKQKDDIEKNPQNAIKIITVNNENQVNKMKEKIKNIMMGIDINIHDNLVNFNLIKDKSKKFSDILDTILNDINNKNKFDNNNFFFCQYHKNKSSILNEITNYIKTSLNFINNNLKNSDIKFEENKEKIENSLNMMSKEISNYEKSCISSILTGRQNRSIILRRYIHFSHNEIKYFKTSVIEFASNNNIFLTGLSLCGLYFKKKKKSIPSLETPQSPDINNININSGTPGIIEENSKKILIQITISTIINQNEGEKLFSQKCELTEVKRIEDPAIIINFEKGINIAKEKLYLIKVENLSENNYIDILTGRVGEIKKKNIQVIRCHNTGIQFLFKQAEGISTDFDEFNQGIIEGVLYSYNK